MSAALFLVVWNEAIERPNCMRILTYSSASSRSRSAPPTISLARQTSACCMVLAKAAAARALGAEQLGLDALEGEVRELARLVHGLELAARRGRAHCPRR